MRLCSKCNVEKPEQSFHKRSSGILHRECKACALTRHVERRRKLKLEAIELLGGKCADCGQSYPSCVYDFHHLNPNEKELEPGIAMQRSRETFFNEISKCVLLCSNCHRLRHRKELE